MKKRLSKKQKEEELKHHARRLSIKEGVFATIKNSFGGHYISPFAIAINASNSLVAMISSVSGLLGPLSQIFGSRLIEKSSRKKLVTKTVFIDSFFWLFYLAVAILFLKGILITSLPLFLIIIFSIHIFFHNLGVPAWYSWIGDIVDEKYRGRWFAKRHLLDGAFTAFFTLTSALLLDFFKRNSLSLVGFAIFFFIAFLGRFACWKTYKRQYEPKYKQDKKSYFSFSDFLLNAHRNNFGRFALFRSMLAFATSISEALLVVYLLRDLQFSYFTYMLVTLFGAGVALATVELWGKLADRYGNYFVLKLTSIGIPIFPVLWVLHHSPLYLLFVPSLIRGISWAGFNLVSVNFVYDNVSPQKRAFAFSYYNMLIGVGVFLGAGLGAILIKVINTSVIMPVAIIFLISAVVRLFVIGFMLPRFSEVRKVRKTPAIKRLPSIFLRTFTTTFRAEVEQIMHVGRYLRE